ncbi:MAG: DUF4419 domain-containing protein [Actinomycetota bacterium]
MATIAPILHRAASKIRFCVDSVTPCLQPLPLQSAKLRFEQRYEKPLLAFSHSDSFEVLEDRGLHPLAAAVHYAFSEHRPLLLSPDIIWMVLAQGFAQHINNFAEELRSYFVRHSGKKVLKVTVNELSEPHHWATAIQEWSLQIRDFVGADLYRLMECNFSTSTPITRTASHIVMMDAFQQYFDYQCRCICGIPNITFLGTVEDWQSIRERVELMGEYDFRWWTDRVLPICEEFINTAAGNPNQEFWKSIYKPQAIYGGEVITGWLAYLFPYLKDPVTQKPSIPVKTLPDIRNQILDIEPEELTVEGGISPHSLPPGLSRAEFVLKTLTSPPKQLELVAGFIGIRQDPDTGILEPEIGWAVREGDDFSSLLDVLQKEHQTNSPTNWAGFNFFEEIPGQMIQLLERFDGAILFDNSETSWYIRKKQDYDLYPIIEIKGKSSYAHHFIDLKDGRCIAYIEVRRKISNLETEISTFPQTEWWVVVGTPVKYSDPHFDAFFQRKELGLVVQDTKVIATSISQFFERVVGSLGRYYFDEPDFVPDELLANLVQK